MDGGKAVRESFLPYTRHTVEEDDISAVSEALRSDLITTGPRVDEFEQSLASTTGTSTAVAVNSGTAALHAMLACSDVGQGDEVIVPVITFAATSNSVLYCGAKPVFVDVDPVTLLIDPDATSDAITTRTKAIIAVDYAGHPCDYEALTSIAASHSISILSDASHSLGGTYKGSTVGSLSYASTFSFHPAKHVTTAEGGAVTTNDNNLALRMQRFRNHGISIDHARRAVERTWEYDVDSLGFNYRISDIQCALGSSQLKRLPTSIAKRRDIARRYDTAFTELEVVSPLKRSADVGHAYHLYVIRLDITRLKVSRTEIFRALWAENIGVNVHYIPVPWHPLYRSLGYQPGGFPVAEDAYRRIISLPMWPGLSDDDVNDVIRAVRKVIATYRQ